jgi:hypothetical protein
MSQQRSLEEKIIEELERTGYPTEIVAASLMQRRGWYVGHNPSYLDDADQRSREYDIYAYRAWDASVDRRKYTVGVYLLAECKKSEKPWVFFTTPEPHLHMHLASLIKSRHTAPWILWTARAADPPLLSDDDLKQRHHYFRATERARTYHEPFKSQAASGQAQMIYAAVFSAIKAVLFHSRQAAFDGFLGLYYPVIIFSGDMFEARVDDAKNISINSTEYVQLAHHYIIPESGGMRMEERQQEFVVDVVHERYIERYCETIETEHRNIASIIQKAIGDGKIAINPR